MSVDCLLWECSAIFSTFYNPFQLLFTLNDARTRKKQRDLPTKDKVVENLWENFPVMLKHYDEYMSKQTDENALETE
jgi:hypothetical protein